MTGLSLVARCFLASTCLVIVCRSLPITEDQALLQSVRTTTEASVTTEEELEFKDVPIFEKDKPLIPAAGTKLVAVLKCPPSSDGQRSHDEKEFPQIIHDPPGTTTKDVPVVPSTQQLIQDKEEGAQSDVTDGEPTSQLVAAAQVVPVDDGQIISLAETEALNDAKDESIPVVMDKLATPSQEPAESSQPSQSVDVPSPDIKTVAVIEDDAKIETAIISDEPVQVETIAEDFVSTLVEKPNPESQVVPVTSDDVKVDVDKVDDLISPAEPDQSDPVSDNISNISETLPTVSTIPTENVAASEAVAPSPADTISKESDPAPVVATISDKVDEIIAPVAVHEDNASEVVASSPAADSISKESDLAPVVATISDKVDEIVAPVAPDQSDSSNISETGLADSAISGDVGKIVASVDIASETLVSVPIDTTSNDSESVPVVATISDEAEEIVASVDVASVPADVISKDSASVPAIPTNSIENDKVVTSETLASVPVDTNESIKKDEFEKKVESTKDVDIKEDVKIETDEPSKVEAIEEDVVSTLVEKPNPESQVVPVTSDDVKVDVNNVENLISPAEPDQSDPSKTVHVVSTVPEDVGKVVASVNVASETLASVPIDTISKESESIPAVPTISGEVGKVVASVDGAPETLVSVPIDTTSKDSASVPVVPTASEDVGKVVASSVSADTNQSIEKDDIDENGFESLNTVDIEEEAVKDYSGYKVYRVTVPTEESARWILKLEDVPGIEFWADPKLLLQPRGMFVTSAADILVSPDVNEYIEEALKQARLPFEILISDVQDAIRNENPSEPVDVEELTVRNGHSLTWERYHSLDDINSYLEYLKVTFPDFVTVTEIGLTTENRPIKAVRLHQNGGRDNKKAILIDAGIHAREWITPATITYMIREIVDNPQKYNCIMNEFDWIFVPVLNPDGYAYTQSHNRMWRKTRSKTDSIVFRQSAEASLRADRLTRFENDPILDDDILEKLRDEVANTKASLSCTGADANRNFDHHWLKGGSSRNPCSDTFAGSKPFSEPEARALRDLVLENKEQLAMYISLHAYSQMWLIPWGYKQEKPEDYSDLYSLAKIGSKALEAVNGVNYLIGTVPDLLYIASGSAIDWVKGEAGVKYSYTVELRDSGRYGFLLPANQILPSGKETWISMYATAVELASRVYTDPANCPAI